MLDQATRNHNANETATLIRAIKTLRQTDFTLRMGSGINVLLTDLAGKPICDEFVLFAEDLEQIKPGIIASIVRMLELRRINRLSEISDINAVIPPQPPAVKTNDG
jgi:hypothetical protein